MLLGAMFMTSMVFLFVIVSVCFRKNSQNRTVEAVNSFMQRGPQGKVGVCIEYTLKQRDWLNLPIR